MKFRTALLAGVATVITAVIAVQAQVPGVNSTLNSVFTLAYDNSTMKQSYSSMVSYVAASGATDTCSISGSATKTIKVRRILWGMIATTATTDPIAFVKRSTANTGGTSTVNLPIAYDTQNAAGTAALSYYTVNPSGLGTLVGVLADPFFSVGNLTTGGAQSFPSEYQFGRLAQPVVLRGTGDVLAVNLLSGLYSGNVTTCGFEWTEE